MKYQEMFRESEEEAQERYALVTGRIASMKRENSVSEPYRDYFCQVAEFIGLADMILQKEEAGELDDRTMEECREMNERLYADVLPDRYKDSYANPVAATKRLGTKFGKLFCFLYAEIRAMAGYAFEGRKMDMTILCELFVEIYNAFEAKEEPGQKEIRDILYWFFHDYSEVFAYEKVRGMTEPEYDFFNKIVTKSDLFDLRYLFRYGEYVGDCEIKTAEFINSLEEEKICSMADTITEGFRTGYEKIGKDLSKKAAVSLEFPVGFERIAKAVIFNFERLGLKTTVYRNPASSFGRSGGRKRGCYAGSYNRQYEFDHKADAAVYLDKAYVQRRLEAMRAAFETFRKQSGRYAGPVVIETFGEEPFQPAIKPEAVSLDEAQNDLSVFLADCAGKMTNEYIPGDERSFTIISYPVPAIGSRFEEIFRETAKINALDAMQYQTMQQKLIDILDTARKVHITGRGENKTDLWVSIWPLKDKTRETAFENCVADVNIPAGEVFTSPSLKGTSGKLHVSKAYLNDLEYLDLEIDFKDGMTERYTCANFQEEEENRKLIYENLLHRNKALPMGEFAIGTNTAAYRMSKDFDIAKRLPILIAEKTGPHFALGDTCYSHAEDTEVFNPDGKEIVARDNEISIRRKEEGGKAYFNCHTDITIPYDELDCVTAVAADGSSRDVISGGKFAVPGTEELNQYL